MRDKASIGADQRVIVIGNGPVGQTAALLLARWGVPVVVLDARERREAVGSKAICQQRDVLDVWDSVGAGAQLAAEGVTWTTARTFYRETELFAVELADHGRSPFPPFVNISQSRTEQTLDERIAGQPLIEVRWGHRVAGIDQSDAGVTVHCASGDGDVRIRGAYAVACAGARGDAVRRMLGVRFDGRTFSDQFLICDIRAELPGWENERRFYFDPAWNLGRQVLIHPCPGSTFRIDWQVPPDFDLAADEASGALDARIRQITGERAYQVVWKSVYRFHSRLVDRMRVGRVLLAGDGAHLVAPFGARGLNSGVLDVENAAWKLAFILRGWADERLLETYHVERHAAAVENVEVTDATMRFLVPRSESDAARRRAVLERAGHDPSARAQVDSGRLAEPFWYVDSPLTTPSEWRRFPGRPPKGQPPQPAPGVLVPDCPIVLRDDPAIARLRQLARTGVCLLHGDDVDPTAVGGAVAGIRVPARPYRLRDLHPRQEATQVLGARPDEVWVLRPDGHIAAILSAPSADQIAAAIQRLTGSEAPAV